MDLKKLDTFRLVAWFGSLSRAAAQRGLTIPAVSIQIKNLETDLGVKLFDHRPNRVSLTHHGRILLREANAILDSVVRAREALTKQIHGYEGSVPISISPDLGRLFAPRIASFVQQHPNLSVTISARRTRESLALVMSGEADMAVGYFRRVPRGILKKTISDTDVLLVVPRGHSLAKLSTLTLAKVFAYRVVTRRVLLGDTLFTKKDAPYFPNLIEVDTCQLAMDFVELRQGVGFVHGICACADPRKNLIKIDMTRHFAKTDISLIIRSKAELGPAAQALMHALMDNSTRLGTTL